MSKMREYMEAALGYDSNGLPASTTQFTFGLAPFQIAETEQIEDVTEISAVCNSDAIVNIQIVDNMVKVSFDFAMETDVLAELFGELSVYMDQRAHVTAALNQLMNAMYLAERNGDSAAVEEAEMQMRATSIPFMMPTILPTCFGGSVHIGFADDPKFVIFESDSLNQAPNKVTMLYDIEDIFAQDDVAIYMGNEEDEIRAQQEEMWYMQEVKRMEEEAYQAQYGYGAGNSYDQDIDVTDKRLKGVRIK